MKGDRGEELKFHVACKDARGQLAKRGWLAGWKLLSRLAATGRLGEHVDGLNTCNRNGNSDSVYRTCT